MLFPILVAAECQYMRSAITKFVPWRAAIAGGAIAAISACPASGQQVPAPETGTRVVNVGINGDRFRINDAENGFEIMPLGYPAYEPLDPLDSQVEFREQPSGLDIVYTLTNSGTQPARMGTFSFGKLNLGNNITYQDFRHIGEPIVADYNNFAAQAFTYPNDLYSPVWVVRNADYAVSLSLQYPVLDYQHDVRIMMRSTSATADPAVYGPRGWIVEFRFGNVGNENQWARIPREGILPAGESRTYVMSLRVTKTPNDWIRLLVPYRNYFKGMYGAVTYRRDDRPVRPVLMAVEHNISTGNPRGWAGYPNQRPDRYSFRPWMDYIKSEPKWSRVMFWAPTGLYNEQTDLNYPFQFASPWADDAQLASALDPQHGFPSLPTAGMTLGLWWGRALQVSRAWNPSVVEHFDPANRDHREAALREMDIAVQAGATDIGLDTFHTMLTPIWKLYPWLRTLRERYPTVKFCIEPDQCDILHTQAAMFISGWHPQMPADGGIDWSTLSNQHYLADLLNPGHESWGAMSYHVHRAHGVVITPSAMQAQAERIAQLGYVPVMFEDVPDPREVRAKDSWMDSVPHDLLRGSGWNINFNQNVVTRGSDGRMKIVNASGVARPGSAPADSAETLPDASEHSTEPDSTNPPAGNADENPTYAASSSSPTKVVIVRSGEKRKPGAKGSRVGSNGRPSVPTKGSRSSSYPRSRSGQGVSAAALARAGLLGKSMSSVSRAQVQAAIERLSTPSPGAN